MAISEADYDASVGTLNHVVEDDNVKESKTNEDAVSTDEENTEKNRQVY